jgi:CubicO group peptidase (beta-lactamase class C family)
MKQWKLVAGLAGALMAFELQAQPHELDAAASDPRTMGWMVGFPPPPERLIAPPTSNFMSFPRLRWTFCHMREMQATRRVSRGLGPASTMSEAPDQAIDELRFTPIGGDKTMTWRESLDANYTDGILIMHRGKIIYEYYSGCLDREGRHGAMSVTKSFVGTVAEILVADGVLDEDAPVSQYVPELAASAFGSATVREVMDMTTSLVFNEDYADPNADIWAYAAAGDPTPKPEDYKGARNFYEYLQGVKRSGEHGEVFRYKSVNTDALAWVIARASGKDFVQHLSERIWSPLGMEQEADMMVDSVGTPLSAGGLSLGLRDAARFGQMMLQGGEFGGERIIPEAVVASIAAGGDPAKFVSAGYTTLPGGSYRSQWWALHNEHGAYSARGIHGQAIYVDPTAEMVIARFATFPVSANAAIDPTSLPAYQAVADYLVKKAGKKSSGP